MEINKLQRVVLTETQLISSSSHILKFVTKILLPFSVLSLILSYPLLCNFQILEYGLQFLFSFSVGKNYMFLLCNGLLVFIATSSGLIGSFPVDTTVKKNKGGNRRELQVESSEQKGSIAKANVIAEADRQQVQESKIISLAPQPAVPEREDTPFVVQDEGEEHRDDQLVSVEEEEEEDEDEGLNLMSNEELNKKFDDFIRKMKEEIKFEARQQILVQ